MNEQTVAKKSPRLIFIDVLRGMAVLWMIETHVINVTLMQQFKQGLFYDWLNMSNGYIAVTFIFCAGAGFWLAAMRKTEEYKKFKPSLWIYIQRLLFILALGYWLHLPAMSLARTWNATYQQMVAFFECDVLHTIVISSLIALFLQLIVPKIKYLPYIFIFLALSVFYLAPLVWVTDPFKVMPPFFATWFSQPPISKFPLFPWSGYFFTGAALTAFFMQSNNKKKFATIVLIISLIVPFITVWIRDYAPITYPGSQNWWFCSPGHSWYRVSISMALFSLLYLIEDWFRGKRLANILQLCGQESLYVYIGHLVIVYGSVASYGMQVSVGTRLNWIYSWLIIFAMWVFFYATAKMWRNTKINNPNMAKLVIYSTVILFLVIFTLNPL